MDPSTIEAVIRDKDLAEEADRESSSALVGGGVVAGAVTGAAVGAVVAGPLGALVGGTLGVVAGALGATAAGSLDKPADPGGTIPGLAEHEVTRTGETGREDLDR